MLSQQQQNFLQREFLNPIGPSGFTSLAALWKRIKTLRNPHNLTYTQVKNWLKQIPSHVALTTPRYNFKRKKVITTGYLDLLVADLLEIRKISRQNSGIAQLLIIKDCFTRYAIYICYL